MFVNTFIKRPVLTTVCTFIILLLGSIAIPNLPISQLPDLAPIQINVTSNNIGADAQTAGAIGKEPAPKNQSYEFSLRATSRLKDISEFENLVRKTRVTSLRSPKLSKIT